MPMIARVPSSFAVRPARVVLFGGIPPPDRNAALLKASVSSSAVSVGPEVRSSAGDRRRIRSTALNAEATVNGTEKKKIIVLGGDGFCGWPTSLYLSDQGHDVVVVDNLSRRNIDTELGCDSLTPIQPPEVREIICQLLCACA